jgi:hypothetical protein
MQVIDCVHTHREEYIRPRYVEAGHLKVKNRMMKTRIKQRNDGPTYRRFCLLASSVIEPLIALEMARCILLTSPQLRALLNGYLSRERTPSVRCVMG